MKPSSKRRRAGPHCCFLARLTVHVFLVALLLRVPVLDTPAAVPVRANTGPAFHPSRIIIKPKSGLALAAAGQLSTFHARQGTRVLRSFPAVGGMQVLQLARGAEVQRTIDQYRRSGLVQYAEPDYEVHATDIPNDPQYLEGVLWALHNTGQAGGVADADIDAPEGWAIRREAADIIVAIIDTGIRYTHEDLAGNVWINPGEIDGNGLDDDQDGYVDDLHGINSIVLSGDPLDDNGHGTHVAGIIGAVGNNGLGVAGVAWKVQLMACKFLNAGGSGYDSDSVACFEYARTHGAKVINCSFGGGGYSQAVKDAIDAAKSAGIVIVAAAGNSSLDSDAQHFYPAGYDSDNIVVVAATTREDRLAHFSNYGQGTVALAAPGQDIVSTWLESDTAYRSLSGTSMAAPIVAGALALMRAQFPDDTVLQLLNRVYGTVDRLPALESKCRTGGRLNLRASLDSVSNRPCNDDFARRIKLAGVTCRIPAINIDATREDDEPSHAGVAGGRSIWWSWHAPANGAVALSAEAAGFKVLLAVYTGTNLSDLTLTAANDPRATGDTAFSVAFEARAGTDYAIALDGFEGASGSCALNLVLSPRPANDNFADRVAITAPLTTVTAVNGLATSEPGEPRLGSAPPAHTLWWSWTSLRSGPVILSTAGSDFDTVLAVYTGSELSQLIPVMSNDDDSAGGQTSRVIFEAVAGTTYQIAVDGQGDAVGTVVLNTPAANDAWTDATLLSGDNTSVMGFNALATREPNEPVILGEAGGKSLWWTWTASDSGPITLITVGSTLDTLLAVYTGSSLEQLVLVAANDDDPYGNKTSLLRFKAVAGTTYYIQVDGKHGASGTIQLTLGTSEYVITELAPIAPFPGSGATAINSDGTVAGYCIGPAPRYLQQACIWKADGSVELICTNSDWSLAMDMNEAGQVVGYMYRSGYGNIAFLWQNGQARQLEGLPESFNSSAEAIDDDGRVLGWSYTPTGYHAFLWQDGVTTDLGTDGARSYAYDQSGPDIIVGNCMNEEASVVWPVVWRNLVIEPIPLPATAREGTAFGVNGLGQVVGGYWDDALKEPHAFWWEDGVRTDLGMGDALCVNNRGEVTGWDRGNTGLLWRNGQSARLADLLPKGSGWAPWYPRRINDWGQIAGAGSLNGNNGTNRAFLMTPLIPPTPRPIMASPTNHQSFDIKTPIRLASWIAPHATNVARVEYFQGATSIGVVTREPYELVWTNVSAGEYALSAVATTLSGATNTSQTVCITVVIPPDSDGDGLPDGWELANGTDPAAPDADCDPDGDHLTNWAEFLAGTKPGDSQSTLDVRIEGANRGTMTLVFQAMPNRRYKILSSSTLLNPDWSTVVELPAQPVARFERVHDPRPQEQARFYRVLATADY